MIPDGALSILAGPPIVVLEVGISQPFKAAGEQSTTPKAKKALLDKANIWLLEGRATRLVILVNVQIEIKSPENNPMVSFGSSTTLSSSWHFQS